VKFTSAGLVSAGADLFAPFTVQVRLDPGSELADSSPGEVVDLVFERVLRALPERRVSGIARLGDKRLFAKIFYGEKPRRYWQRELLGAQRLAKAKVPTPIVLARGAMADDGGYVVCYEALNDVSSLNPNQLTEVLAATRLLAELHEAGFVQSDVHVGNFMQREGQVFAVDADGVRSTHKLRHHFANLGLFMAQRAPVRDGDMDKVWDAYVEVRGEYVAKMGDVQKLIEHTDDQRNLRVARYLKKTQRACTEFLHRESWRTSWLCDRHHWPALQRFSVFPEEHMEAGTPLKLGNSATVVRIRVDGVAYIVKRYNVKSLSHRVRRWFKRRARRAWCSGHHLAFLEIAAAKPIALLEQRHGWFVGVCYLVMPDCGERHLGHMLDVEDPSFPKLVDQTVSILKGLRAARIEHGDLKATNFVLRDDAVALIDYDGMRPAGVGGSESDMKRFMRNWDEHPDVQTAWRTAIHEAGL